MRTNGTREWRWAFLAAALGSGAACSSSSEGWTVRTETPMRTEAVIDAVGNLMECGKVREGGVLTWRAGQFECNGTMVNGCAWPGEKPMRVEVAYRPTATDSALAHELCHICGYKDEAEADACAFRALLTLE